jgi:glycosyltransferase involved in cell wall biosynthesis
VSSSAPAAVNVTVVIAARNEQANLPKCLAALAPAARVIVLDSHSQDQTAAIAVAAGAEVVQFDYQGGYPKKRQWALDTLDLRTEWVLLLDADEVVPAELWLEIREAIAAAACNGFLITKGFHFLGKRFRFGGFSFAAVLLIRRGHARFERLLDKEPPGHGMDMEVHERLIVDGPLGRLKTPLVHEDFKDLQAYLDRHNRYSTWEAAVRYAYLTTGRYGRETVGARLLGNTQERRRFLKGLIVRLPLEPWLWFGYHFFLQLGFLEGKRGLIASQMRSSYISQVRAKVYEMKVKKWSIAPEPPLINGV